MRSSGEMLIVFLAGMVVGAGVALVTAPQSGAKTRRQIRRKAEDAQSYLEEMGEDLMEKGRELIERGKEAAETTAKDFGKKVREATF